MKATIAAIIVVSIAVVGCYSTMSLPSIEQAGEVRAIRIPSSEQQTPPASPPLPRVIPPAAPIPPVYIPEGATTPRTFPHNDRLILVPPKKQSTVPKPVPEKTKPQWSEELQRANLALSIPDKSNITDDVRVELIISIEKNVQQLLSELSEPGRTSGDTLLVSRVVVAHITAPDFDVTPVTPERQALSAIGNTSWLWTLQPKSAGTHKIDVSVTAIVKLDGTDREHHIKTFKKTVEVEIKLSQLLWGWIVKYWQWLASTIVIPLAIWYFKSRRNSTTNA